jgi:hypothetical protein
MPARNCLRLTAAWLAVLVTAGVSAKPVSSLGLAGPGPGNAPQAILAAADESPLAEAQFDSTIVPLPPGVLSLGFEDTNTAEFGDFIRFDGTAHFIESVTVTFASGAIRSDYPALGAYGFSHPLTLTIYAVDRSSGLPQRGAVLSTVTTPILVPWRPEPDLTAPMGPERYWRGADGNYYARRAFEVTFQLGPLAHALPDEVVFGVSFNTEHSGPAPLGTPGPYNALHLGLTDLAPAVGTDVESDTVFWRNAQALAYSDSGAGGVNVLRRDVGWGAYRPAVRFNNSPFGTLAGVEARIQGQLNPNGSGGTSGLLDARALAAWALTPGLWDGTNRLRGTGGRLVFQLLAGAAEQLSERTDAESSLEPMVAVAEALANNAIGDAVLLGRNGSRTAAALESFDAAIRDAAAGHFAPAIEQFGDAWREAQRGMQDRD